ncbi:MAG: methylthioribose-1-phosphate isomerase [Phenylobacterium sp.]|jgi:methylthioribose-1-phosphate isomerase
MWPTTLTWQEGKLTIVDQTLLPTEFKQVEQTSIEQVWASIKQLKVRGAPAIGVAAAYGLVIGLKPHAELAPAEFMAKVIELADYLDSSRPTAVNLHWALQRMKLRAQNHAQSQIQSRDILGVLTDEAQQIHAQDAALCRGIGENGLPLVKEGMGILTHCNAGALATAGMGTALAPLYLAHEAGLSFKVYADETRPLLQGARLTAWEMDQAGIDITLITDNMAAHLMQQGHIQMVIVGTDRVAENGDVCNKIGTLGVAILARYFNIPFYVACPSSTIDFSTPTGDDIEIEEREGHEVLSLAGVQTAPPGIGFRNPAFDVTPAELVTGIITERGVINPPLKANLRLLFNDLL